MQLEQASIFDFLEDYQDDVRLQLQGLQLNEEIKVSTFLVRLTTSGYEIENREIHTGFLSLKECYSEINCQINR
jgi:hypothetical protein